MIAWKVCYVNFPYLLKSIAWKPDHAQGNRRMALLQGLSLSLALYLQCVTGKDERDEKDRAPAGCNGMVDERCSAWAPYERSEMLLRQVNVKTAGFKYSFN